MLLIKKKVKLDDFEKEIETGETYKTVSLKTENKIEQIIQSSRKTKSINIRVSEQDLLKIKNKSTVEGLPYQTLITSVLHKYVNNQLIDEASIIKAIETIKKAA